MRFAYADPPYPGQSKRLYGHHPDYAGEVDHRALIARLVTEYPDGWALSTGSKWLQELLALCPDGIRVLAWVKTISPPFSCRIQYFWEPVILSGGRPFQKGDSLTVRDVLICQPPGTKNFDPQRESRGDSYVTGMKPPAFARWVFACLGARSGDELHDLFPGSGIVGREWEAYERQGQLVA